MRYFVISDIHDHYDEMILALNNAGFDYNDNNHKIILLGDAFDRGEKTVEVFLFVKSMIEKNKLIWVAGNHEFLILYRLREKEFKRHNDTYNTLLKLAQYSSKREILSDEEIFIECDKLKLEEFLKENLLPYYEIDEYVFAHGFIPNKNKTYIANWREYAFDKWYTYTTKNGMRCAMIDGIKIPGKTLVCGHTRASFGNVRKNYDVVKWDDKSFNKLQKYKKNIEDFKPYYGDGVIGIDGCCTETSMINCLVIEK